MQRSRLNRLPPFVPLTWQMLNSEAYKSLNFASAKILPYFIGKVKTSYNDPQRYFTDFQFSYREAIKLGFSRATHHRNIKELVEKGFIDPIAKGGLRSDGKSSNLFRLSKRWEKYAKSDFEEMKWGTFLHPIKVF